MLAMQKKTYDLCRVRVCSPEHLDGVYVVSEGMRFVSEQVEGLQSWTRILGPA